MSWQTGKPAILWVCGSGGWQTRELGGLVFWQFAKPTNWQAGRLASCQGDGLAGGQAGKLVASWWASGLAGWQIGWFPGLALGGEQ